MEWFKKSLILTIALVSSVVFADYEHCNQILVNGVMDTFLYKRNTFETVDYKHILCTSESSEKSENTGANIKAIIEGVPAELGFTHSSLDKWKKDHCDNTSYAETRKEKIDFLHIKGDPNIINAWDKCIAGADQGLNCSVTRSPYREKFSINIKWVNNHVGRLSKFEVGGGKYLPDNVTTLNSNMRDRDFVKPGDEVVFRGVLANTAEDTTIDFSGITRSNTLVSCSVIIPRIEKVAPPTNPEMFEKYQSTATHCYGFGDMTSQTAGQICSFITGGHYDAKKVDKSSTEFSFYWHQDHGDGNCDNIYVSAKGAGTNTYHCSRRGLNLDAFCARYGECGFDVIDRRGPNMGPGDKALSFKFNPDKPGINSENSSNDRNDKGGGGGGFRMNGGFHPMVRGVFCCEKGIGFDGPQVPSEEEDERMVTLCLKKKTENTGKNWMINSVGDCVNFKTFCNPKEKNTTKECSTKCIVNSVGDIVHCGTFVDSEARRAEIERKAAEWRSNK